MLGAHVEYLDYKSLFRDTSFFRISPRKKLYWLTPTFSDFVVTFYRSYFCNISKYSDISSKSPWNRNIRLRSTLRASRCEESEFSTVIFLLSGTGRSTWAPFSGFSGLLRCRWHGTLAQAVRQRFQPEKPRTGRPRQKRELAVAEASEPAGRNVRIFRSTNVKCFFFYN